MKAVQINSYDGTEVVDIQENAQKPILQTGQVLVEVYAGGMNPIDWKLKAGYLKEYVPLTFPVTLGGDFAGVITQIGEDVTEFTVGDKVYGQAGILNGGSGAFAQFAAASVTKISQKPKNINFNQAAALPLAGISALQGVEDTIKLTKDQKILIHGGAGGIGSFAIQIAKALDAYVVTTVGTDGKTFAAQLGADETIDYKNEKIEEKLKDFDAVFDTVGGETTNKSFQVLRKGGILVSMAGKPDEELGRKYGVTTIGQSTEATPKRLTRLTELVESGQVKIFIDRIFPFADVKNAFAHLEKDHPKGKVVLQIKEE